MRNWQANVSPMQQRDTWCRPRALSYQLCRA